MIHYTINCDNKLMIELYITRSLKSSFISSLIISCDSTRCFLSFCYDCLIFQCGTCIMFGYLVDPELQSIIIPFQTTVTEKVLSIQSQ